MLEVGTKAHHLNYLIKMENWMQLSNTIFGNKIMAKHICELLELLI